MTIQAVKAYNTERGDMEDLVFLFAVGTLAEQTFKSLEIDVPEWLEPKLKQISREIDARNSDKLIQRLSEAKMRLESLKTPIEKKTALQKEIKRLEALVAKA